MIGAPPLMVLMEGRGLQDSLEGALQGQLRTALTKPMQDNFRASFQQLLLPAFEGACQSMFSQVCIFIFMTLQSMILSRIKIN